MGEMAQKVAAHGQTMPGLAQYAVKKFSESLEIIPRIMAENAGVKPTELISNLYAAHSAGEKNVGFDIEGEGCATLDSAEASIFDSYLVNQNRKKTPTGTRINKEEKNSDSYPLILILIS